MSLNLNQMSLMNREHVPHTPATREHVPHIPAPPAQAPINPQKQTNPMSVFSAINPRSGEPILTAREVKKYSLISALRQALPGGRRGFEREASDAVVVRSGRPASGLAVPAEVFFGLDEPAFRTLSATSAESGGYTVGTGIRPLADYVFGQSGIFALGATMVGDLEDAARFGSLGSQSLPAIESAAEGEWVAESASPTDDFTPSFTQSVGGPKRVVATVAMSKQWLAQTGNGAEAIVRRHLMGAVAAALDRGAIAGAGNSQPIGLINKDGVTVVAMGTDGGAPTLAKLNEIEEGVINARLLLDGSGYVISKNTRDVLKRTAKASNTSSFLLETINGRDYVNGFPAFATTFMPDDLTKGSGSSLGSIAFGRFDMLEVLLWGGADVVVDGFTRAREHMVEVTVNVLADVITGRPAAFARSVDVITT